MTDQWLTEQFKFGVTWHHNLKYRHEAYNYIILDNVILAVDCCLDSNSLLIFLSTFMQLDM